MNNSNLSSTFCTDNGLPTVPEETKLAGRRISNEPPCTCFLPQQSKNQHSRRVFHDHKNEGCSMIVDHTKNTRNGRLRSTRSHRITRATLLYGRQPKIPQRSSSYHGPQILRQDALDQIKSQQHTRQNKEVQRLRQQALDLEHQIEALEERLQASIDERSKTLSSLCRKNKLIAHGKEEYTQRIEDDDDDEEWNGTSMSMHELSQSRWSA